MQHTPNLTANTALSATNRADVLLGRADWTWPDYVAAGERWYDEQPRHPRWIVPTSRSTCARAWAELNCPPAKRAAWVEQQRAALLGDAL